MSIKTKFDINQEVYTIIDKVEKMKIEKVFASVGKLEDENLITYSVTDSYGYALRLPEEQLFATKEEAESKLKELKK